MASASRIEGIAGGSGRGVSGMTRGIKSSPKVLKEASKKESAKLTAKEREYQKDKVSRKEMKQIDTFYNKANKEELRKGKKGLSGVSSKSQSKALTPKVPVKKK